MAIYFKNTTAFSWNDTTAYDWVSDTVGDVVIDTPEISVSILALSDIQIQIYSPAITVVTEMSSDMLLGLPTLTPEITVSTTADSDIKIQIDSPAISTETLIESILQIQILSPELSVVTSMSNDLPVTFTTVNSTTFYLFTLTGTADSTTDVEIPISSFQCRMRSGDPTYLSVVVPGSEYATDITARVNGTLQIEMAYKQDGVYLQREIIVQADLETVAIDEGEDNQSITLTGHKTETFTAKTVPLGNSIYRSVKSGKIRHRIAKPNIYLKPGDTVTVESDTFTADAISYAISVDSQTMEVAEA